MTAPAVRGRVTLTDIADACELSRATVSLVLRGSPLVNAQTRVRVEAELKRQGYVYHRGAANLRRKESSTVALVINDLSNPFFAEFAAGVDEALAAAGYVTLLGSTGESSERQQAVLTLLLEHDPAGIILSPAEGSDGARLRPLLASRTPTLVFNPRSAKSGITSRSTTHTARDSPRNICSRRAIAASRSSAGTANPVRASSAARAGTPRSRKPASRRNRSGSSNTHRRVWKPRARRARCSCAIPRRRPPSATTTPSRWGSSPAFPRAGAAPATTSPSPVSTTSPKRPSARRR